MSVRAISQVWGQSQASGTTLLVLLALADHASDQGVCFPHITSLASKARCDEKTVRRSIRWLQDQQELDIWEWYDKRSGRKRNAYRVVVGEFTVFRGIEPDDIRERATVLRVNIPTAKRRAVFERDGWACVKCLSKIDLTIDHVVPVDAGGGNEIENLETLCAVCNAKKSAGVPDGVEARPGEMSGRLVEPDVRSGAGEMSGPRARGSVELEPSVEPSVDSPPPPDGPPPVWLDDEKQNLPLNALCTACRIAPGSPRIALAVVALNGRGGQQGIRALYWGECVEVAAERGADDELAALHADPERFSRLLAARVDRKVGLIRTRQPWRTDLSPSAVRDLWLDIELAPSGAGSGVMTGEDLERIANG